MVTSAAALSMELGPVAASYLHLLIFVDSSLYLIILQLPGSFPCSGAK